MHIGKICSFDYIGLLCSGSASQTRESIRHPVGKEGGRGGSGWQSLASCKCQWQQFNNLGFAVIKADYRSRKPIPCIKGKEKRWKSIWRVMMAFVCNWLGVKLIRQSPGFSTARKKSKYKATDRWDQDQIWPKNWNKNNLQHASPVQCSATVFVQVNKWLRSGGGLDENNEKAFRRSLRHSPCHKPWLLSRDYSERVMFPARI